MQKLYIYVDESGQDTEGRIFVVTTVIIPNPESKDETHALCEAIEHSSKKGKSKWGKAKSAHRLNYMERIFAEKSFHGNLRYAFFRDTTDYDQATIGAITRVIQWDGLVDYTALIFIDALSDAKCQQYTLKMRKLGLRVQKIRGITKDENNAFIRLADALAGFIRDVVDDNATSGKELFERAKKKKVLIEV